MASRRNLLQISDGSSRAIVDDLKQLGIVTRDLSYHVAVASATVSILRWLATFAAIFLIGVDRTNWKTDLLTGLLVPYIWLNLPPSLFGFLAGEVGKWISFVAIIVRLFFPQRFPEEADLPVSLILLIVTSPSFLVEHSKNSILGVFVSLVIGAYLMQQHIRNAGGFKNAFAAHHGIPNTVGIILLFVSPVNELIHLIL